MSDLVKKLLSYPSATCKDEDIYDAADHIEALEKEKSDHLLTIQSYSDLIRETTKQNTRLRSTLIAIQTKVQDILRPIPFQDEEN